MRKLHNKLHHYTRIYNLRLLIRIYFRIMQIITKWLYNKSICGIMPNIFH